MTPTQPVYAIIGDRRGARALSAFRLGAHDVLVRWVADEARGLHAFEQANNQPRSHRGRYGSAFGSARRPSESKYAR